MLCGGKLADLGEEKNATANKREKKRNDEVV